VIVVLLKVVFTFLVAALGPILVVPIWLYDFMVSPAPSDSTLAIVGIVALIVLGNLLWIVPLALILAAVASGVSSAEPSEKRGTSLLPLYIAYKLGERHEMGK
jgi:hypothetical protein